MDGIQKDIDAKQAQIDQESAKIATYEQAGDQARVANETNRISQLQREVSVLSDQLMREQSEADTNQRHMADIDRQIPPLQKDIETTQARIQTDTMHIETLQKRIDDLTARRQSYE